jgi:hypothetical protein
MCRSSACKTSGPALFSTQPEAHQAAALSLLREAHPDPEPQIQQFYGQRVLSQVLPLGNSGGGDQVRVLLQSPLDHAVESFAPLDRQFLGIALGVLLVSLAGALFLARHVSRPLNALVDAADASAPVITARRYGCAATMSSACWPAPSMPCSGIAVRERQLAHNALHDPLTGLPNRALAMERLGSAISARRPVVLLYLGIENYRVINEGFGPLSRGNAARSQPLPVHEPASQRHGGAHHRQRIPAVAGKHRDRPRGGARRPPLRAAHRTPAHRQR